MESRTKELVVASVAGAVVGAILHHIFMGRRMAQQASLSRPVLAEAASSSVQQQAGAASNADILRQLGVPATADAMRQVQATLDGVNAQRERV